MLFTFVNQFLLVYKQLGCILISQTRGHNHKCQRNGRFWRKSDFKKGEGGLAGKAFIYARWYFVSSWLNTRHFHLVNARMCLKRGKKSITHFQGDVDQVDQSSVMQLQRECEWWCRLKQWQEFQPSPTLAQRTRKRQRIGKKWHARRRSLTADKRVLRRPETKKVVVVIKNNCCFTSNDKMNEVGLHLVVDCIHHYIPVYNNRRHF